MARWTFLTNHAHVLLCVAANPEILLRDVATLVGVTERAAQRIVGELEQEGYLTRERVGRRNTYRLNPDRPLRHPLDQGHHIGELLDTFAQLEAADPGRGPRRAGASALEAEEPGPPDGA